MRRISGAKGRDISPENLFVPAPKRGLARRFEVEIRIGFGRFNLPLRRRYPIIVKSGKDIQPFFVNPLQTALMPTVEVLTVPWRKLNPVEDLALHPPRTAQDHDCHNACIRTALPCWTLPAATWFCAFPAPRATVRSCG